LKLGISSWTYPWAIGVPGYQQPADPLDAFDLLERAATLGVALVQIADNLPLETMPPAAVARLGSTARETGLALEIGTRGIEPSHLYRFLDIARCLHAGLVRTLTANNSPAPPAEQIEASLREVLPAYEQAGVQLALENYEQQTSEELADLVRRIDSPCLGVCLDTVNSLGALEGPAEVTRFLLPIAFNLHVKDFGIERVPSRMGYLVIGRPAGTGRLDVPALLDQARRHGREPSVIVEQWPPFSDTLAATIALEAEWAEQSVRYLQQYLCN
jgi:sugar phosphate isomerase/epimerase